MNIDKKLLINEYKNGDYNSFFKSAAEITGFIISKKYYTIAANEDEYRDLIQDCMVSLWEKHISNKINIEKGDLMSFIWKNSTFKIMDYLKKKKRRERIAVFVSYDEVISNNYRYGKGENSINESD